MGTSAAVPLASVTRIRNVSHQRTTTARPPQANSHVLCIEWPCTQGEDQILLGKLWTWRPHSAVPDRKHRVNVGNHLCQPPVILAIWISRPRLPRLWLPSTTLIAATRVLAFTAAWRVPATQATQPHRHARAHAPSTCTCVTQLVTVTEACVRNSNFSLRAPQRARSHARRGGVLWHTSNGFAPPGTLKPLIAAAAAAAACAIG